MSKKDKGEKSEEEAGEEKDNKNGEEKSSKKSSEPYKIEYLEDYFWAIRDLFNDFRMFIKATDKIVNLSLNSLREVVQMIVSGKPDYNRVVDILSGVNEELRNYLDRHEKMILNITYLTDELSNEKKVQDLFVDFFMRLATGRLNTKALKKFRSSNPEQTDEDEEFSNLLVPSAIIKEPDDIKKLFSDMGNFLLFEEDEEERDRKKDKGKGKNKKEQK
ncbi:hypothetical protein HRbin19_01593 [bacterium HR19]|nr:hypothetical protein HRbin19_01593 [bacterium HR19]